MLNISYQIDNHSDIIPIKLLKECYDYGRITHWRKRKLAYIINPKKKGCYFLYDKNKSIIYIGKATISIRSRILYHLFVPYKDYLNEAEIEKILLKRKYVKYFSFIEVKKEMIDFVERGLINKYQPLLNIEFINK